MESRQSCAATPTHYSTEPLTPGPDYDPLLLLLALAGDVHPNPGPSSYPCSDCFKNVTSQGTSYLCTRCSHWVHSRCSGLRNAADYRKANGWICTACMTPPQSRAPPPPPTPAHMPTISDKTFNILQWNANGIGSKQTELSFFLEAHNVKVAAIQESKLTAKSRSPNIQNYTLVRQDRRLGPGGGLLFFIHNSVSFTRKPLSTMSKNDPHLEELTISIAMDNTELLITNVYIPPASSCNGRYSPPLDHLLTGTDSLVLGDFNAHHSLWHAGTTDTRGNQLADSVSTSSFAVLNTDSPTRLPGSANPSSPDVSLASTSLITSSEWQTHTTMSSDHLPILIGLQTTATSSPARHRTYINLKKADWTGYRQEIERKLSSRHLPTYCQKDEKLFRATLLKAASHHIPTGRRKLYTQQVPAEILAMMEERDDLRKQDPASPRLSTMNDEITKATSDHKRRQWREFVESIDHRTGFQRLQPARGGTAQRKIFLLANCHLIHPGPSSSRSRFFMESSQSCAATLTHYSTEPLTPGPDYDPLLLLLALAGDVHPNPGPSRYPCSVCFKNVTSQGTSYLCTRCSHWVHSRCSGLRNAADYRKANGWICTACMTPPQSRAPPPPPTPAHMPTISDKTFNILQWNANGIDSKQTELSIFLEAHNVKVAAIQES